jgi:hypothetical protein
MKEHEYYIYYHLFLTLQKIGLIRDFRRANTLILGQYIRAINEAAKTDGSSD